MAQPPTPKRPRKGYSLVRGLNCAATDKAGAVETALRVEGEAPFRIGGVVLRGDGDAVRFGAGA